MTLSDILGRDVSLEWHEAVAVVRGVVELLEKSTGTIAVPELDQVEVFAAGHVNVSGGTNVDELVRRLGQLLQATLAHTEAVPVQLRLFILRATAIAPAPSFDSIRQYDEALAYFERPGRDAILQALYVRAAAAPLRSDSSGASTLDSIAPLPTAAVPENAGKDAVRKSQPRRRRLVVGALVLFGTICGMLYAGVGGIVPAEGNVPAIALKALNVGGAAMVSGLSAVTERAGLGRLVATDPAAMNLVVTPVSASPQAARATSARAVVKPAMATFEAVDQNQSPLVSSATSADDGWTDVPRYVTPKVARDEDLIIYSAESEGVSPPLGVHPQLPTELLANTGTERPGRIDLIISPIGIVESVKLVGAPRSVHDSMLLSAAKAWRFEPALKDGVPVRYRKTILIASQ